MSVPGRSAKYRLVLRASGDTTPLDPKIAEAVRKAGMDPDRFTLAPFEPGEAAAPIGALFTPGARLEHTFSFETVNAALSAIERVVDEECAARISRQDARWVVVFDGPADPNASAAAAHEKLASRIAGLGGEDRGFSHLTMNMRESVRNADR